MAANQNQYLEKFIESFDGTAEDVRVFFAPGRVNLIGEHTDYNGGYVFPAALTYGIWAIARKREDRTLRLRSLNFEQVVECSLDSLVFKKEDDWANYPKGVVHELVKSGARLSGADILFYGNIPNGAGLSSSAAIELVTAVTMTGLNGLQFDMLELVKLSQRAENQFVGVNCGIMDQFAVGMGKEDHAVFLNCQNLDYTHVPLKIDGYKLVITNTNKRRGLADSKYNERRSECEQGVEQIKQWLPNIDCLGDLSLEAWNSVKDRLEDPVIVNRVQHVVEEDDRVLKAREVLNHNQIEEFGRLMLASHDSLRDLYEVTGVELDTLVDIARGMDGCVGTRMTGAGFGGCTVSLVREDAVEAFRQQVAPAYEQRTGLTPDFYVCNIGSGAREITPEVEKWPS